MSAPAMRVPGAGRASIPVREPDATFVATVDRLETLLNEHVRLHAERAALLDARIADLMLARERLTAALCDVQRRLNVPAADYARAISDVLTVIDEALA